VQPVRQLGPDTALKITTARYYTPSGRAIQAKGIVPEVMLDETENGNVFSALRTREADLEKHLSNGKEAEEKKDPAREKAREQAIKKLEEESKKPVADRRLPEFGSDKDFQLIQALRQLKGLPVKASTTLAERKVEKKDD
jgi:carboxyl-terminal processing protease